MYAFRALSPLARKQAIHQRRMGAWPHLWRRCSRQGNPCLAVHREALALLLATLTEKKTIVIAIDTQAKPSEQTQKAGASRELPNCLTVAHAYAGSIPGDVPSVRFKDGLRPCANAFHNLLDNRSWQT